MVGRQSRVVLKGSATVDNMTTHCTWRATKERSMKAMILIVTSLVAMLVVAHGYAEELAAGAAVSGSAAMTNAPAVQAGAPTSTPAPAPPVRPSYPREINPPWAFFRGCVNLATGWLELPRNIFIENVNYPVLGIGSGLLKGLFFTTSRIVLGVVDVAMFGMTGPSAFSPDLFPEFVFQARWSPYAPPAPLEQSLQVEFEEEEAAEENMETP